jgi:hypothetical protein
MKKLALAIALGAYIVFGTSAGSLAAHRADSTSAVAARVAWSETGTNARLLFLNEQLYPETTVWGTDTTFCVDESCISR